TKGWMPGTRVSMRQSECISSIIARSVCRPQERRPGGTGNFSHLFPAFPSRFPAKSPVKRPLSQNSHFLTANLWRTAGRPPTRIDAFGPHRIFKKWEKWEIRHFPRVLLGIRLGNDWESLGIGVPCLPADMEEDRRLAVVDLHLAVKAGSPRR